MANINIKNKFSNLSENDKIIYTNVIGAFVVKGIALFVTLYTLPAYIAFFNNSEVLGLWFTILSLLTWILNFDLGIGNGLRNYLSASLVHGDYIECKRYISSAYFSIGAIVLTISIVFLVVSDNLNFNFLLNIDEALVSSNALYVSVVIVFVGVMLQFWLKLINSILYAMQKSSVNNFLMLCTNVLILLYVKFAPSYSNDENIVAMAIVHTLAVLLPLLIATICVFAGKLRTAIPSPKYVTLYHIKKVLSLGGAFFIIQIAFMVIMSTNEYLISTTTGNSDVIPYQAYYKLFSIGSTIFALALTPIWSVITKAKAENNYMWIKKTFFKFSYIAIAFCLGELVLIFLTKPLMTLWLGDSVAEIDINYTISAVFAFYAVTMIIVSLLSSIANGLGTLKTQATSYILGALLKIPLAFLFVDLIGGWIGVVVANVVCLLIYCIVQPFILLRFFNNKLCRI